MDFLNLIVKFVIATLLGSLIGLERQFAVRRFADESDRGYVGIRTFSFYSLLGAIAEYLGNRYGVSIVIASFSGLLVFIAGYYYFTATMLKDRGITTEVSSLITFWLGVLVVDGEITLAVTIAVIVTFLLSLKPRTEKLIKKITEDELFAILEFVLVSFVILPILPNKGYGPYAFFNPYEIWLFVVLILGVSFAGYIAIRIIGPQRGIGVTSLLGGLASSTAVTVSFARRSVEEEELSPAFAMGVILASSIMFFRMIIIIWVINEELMKSVLFPLTFIGLVGVAFSAFLYFKKRVSSPEKSEIKLSNPFRLSQGIYIGVLYSLIIYLVEWGKHRWGASGVTWISFISGLPDVDAITLSLSKLGGEKISLSLATKGIVIASIANSITKMFLALLLGSKEMRKISAAGFILLIIAGLISLYFFIPG